MAVGEQLFQKCHRKFELSLVQEYWQSITFSNVPSGVRFVT